LGLGVLILPPPLQSAETDARHLRHYRRLRVWVQGSGFRVLVFQGLGFGV